MQNVESQDVITVWYMTRWKGSIIVTDAGTNKIIQKLELLQQKEDKKLSFLKLNPEEDKLQHVRSLQFVTKGPVNVILKNGAQIYNYPCITKVFEPVNGIAKGKFPKEKTRDPVTCAKIQYMLCENYPEEVFVKHLKDNALHCRCQCDNCYKLAFEAYYRKGALQCRK